jgi:hypothetical protein
MRVTDREEREVPWRSLRSRRGRILADHGLGAHPREKRKREDGFIPGQLLGNDGGARACPGMQRGYQSTGTIGGLKKRGSKDPKNIGIGLLCLLPSKTLQECYSERGLGAGGAGERSEVVLISFKGI